MNRVTLDSLCGKHTLDAVDVHNPAVMETMKLLNPELQDAAMFLFRLDGVVYLAIEDPNDGYRSSMEGLYDMGPGPMTNVFPACEVVGSMKGPNEVHDHNNTLVLRSTETRGTVLEVGTDNSDDYYPHFVAYFDPKQLPCNRGK